MTREQPRLLELPSTHTETGCIQFDPSANLGLIDSLAIQTLAGHSSDDFSALRPLHFSKSVPGSKTVSFFLSVLLPKV